MYELKLKSGENLKLTFWDKNKEKNNEDIKIILSKRQRLIKDETNNLNEEQINTNKKSRVISRYKVRRSISTDQYENLSKRVKQILTSVAPSIKYIKDTTNSIATINSLYVDKYVKPPPITLHKNSSVNDIRTLSPPSPSFPKIIKNFSYINNHYRKNLNKAFMKFNPKIHLENLYFLQCADPSIKKDIEKLRESVDADINEITDAHHYKHKYDELIQKNRRLRKDASSFSNDSTNVNSPMHSEKNVTRETGIFRKGKNFSKGRLKQLGEIKRKFPQKELRVEELERMVHSLEQIDKMISPKNIVENIGSSVRNGVIKNQERRFNRELPYSKPEDYFNPQRRRIIESLGGIYTLRLAGRESNLAEKNLKMMLKRDQISFGSKMKESKEGLLREIDGLAKKTEVSI